MPRKKIAPANIYPCGLQPSAAPSKLPELQMLERAHELILRCEAAHRQFLKLLRDFGLHFSVTKGLDLAHIDAVNLLMRAANLARKYNREYGERLYTDLKELTSIATRLARDCFITPKWQDFQRSQSVKMAL